MKTVCVLVKAVLVAVSIASPAAADIIFQSGTPSTAGAFVSDYSQGYWTAGEFVLAEGAATVTDLHWWGFYIPSNTPLATDTFRITIFQEVAGIPGIPVLEMTTTEVSRTLSEYTFGEIGVYAYAMDIEPLALTAGATYWLSIVNDTTVDTNDTWNWSMSTSGGYSAFTSTIGGRWQRRPNNVAFYLTDDNLRGDVVPEPATVTLLGVALTGLAIRRRFR